MPTPPTDAIAPNPHLRHPMPAHQRVVLLRSILSGSNISAGDYSYYDDPNEPERFQERNVLYHYASVGDRLDIGRYCALATGATFIMNGANHRMDGLSTYPFPVMGGAWAAHLDLLAGLPTRGDTKIGNDVWLGYRTLVLPGVSIGNGAIVGAGAVVSTNIPDYAIAAGNPAQIVRMRFDARTIARLLDIAWWDWPADRVTANIRALMAGDVAALEAAAP